MGCFCYKSLPEKFFAFNYCNESWQPNKREEENKAKIPGSNITAWDFLVGSATKLPFVVAGILSLQLAD
jgi:hypothetical protein